MSISGNNKVAYISVEFNDQNQNWTTESEFNTLFLRCIHNYAKYLLKSRGHLFLNEILDMLSLTRSSEGQLKGWLYENKINKLWKEELQADGKTTLITFDNINIMYDKI
jgi:hypothetical protein